jgi:hypothetical protein
MTSLRERGHQSKPACCGCLALLLLMSACNRQTVADTRVADEKAVIDVDAQWSKTAGANDLDGTVLLQ